MAKIKITQQENNIVLNIDDSKTPYNVIEYSVHQEAGKKPVLTFLAPMSLEIDSLEIEGLPTPAEPEPAHEATMPRFVG